MSEVLFMANTASPSSSSYKRPSILPISMEPCTYKQVLLTTISPSRLLQARKTLERILERLKIWMYSVLHTRMLVDPHLEVQDASSGSVESTRSSRHESVTCQSSGINSANDPDLPLPLSEPPHGHVKSNEDNYQDGDISEEGFWVHNDYTQYISNASEEPVLCKDSVTVVSWTRDTPSPSLNVWHQRVEACDCIDEEDGNPFVNILCESSSVVLDIPKPENNNQDTQDIEFRVVITPPDDSWETCCYTADNNRIGTQYFTSLVVPPFYQFTSRLVKYEEWMAFYHPPVRTVSHDQLAVTPSRTPSGPSVFSLRVFQKHLQETRHDRIKCCHVVTALQRYQVKAAAFTASLRACLFRTRYDIPGFLENIEPRFKWIDPAEILIESFRHTPQSVTIYTSHRPCSVPHIAIHESPPNDPYVVWNNSSDLQNYCFLSISSPNPSLWGKDDDRITDKFLTDTTSSHCKSSTLATPKDFSTTLQQDLDMLFGDGTYDTEPNDHIHQPYEEEFMVPQYSKSRDDTTLPSKSKFFIPDDDEEDGLPPLDDWYITIANRCMPPEEAKAVAAVAAKSQSCH